ncbi:MAG: hypothetical protein H7Z14_13620 [Anaerolineae bacterium]|nr:hypothetical protein [Phycisphaerae bacterium]
MESSSRRAAQFGLGAAIILLITCVTLIVGAAVHAGPSNIPPSAQSAVIR